MPLRLSRALLLPGLLLPGLLVLAACTAPSPATPVDPATRFRATGGAHAVTVLGAGDEASARPVAERHCAAYGRTARFVSIRDNPVGRHAVVHDVAFACV